MQVNRRWYWLGAALVVAGAALAAGVLRYSRHIILPKIGAAGQRKLLDARVLCVGAGGLGSPAAMYLAMGMMGRPGTSQAGGDPAHQPGSPPMHGEMALSGSPPPSDPLAILKLRLAKGDITLEEYERLGAVLADPGAASKQETA